MKEKETAMERSRQFFIGLRDSLGLQTPERLRKPCQPELSEVRKPSFRNGASAMDEWQRNQESRQD